jgi:hypothetical protein
MWNPMAIFRRRSRSPAVLGGGRQRLSDVEHLRLVTRDAALLWVVSLSVSMMRQNERPAKISLSTSRGLPCETDANAADGVEDCSRM